MSTLKENHYLNYFVLAYSYTKCKLDRYINLIIYSSDSLLNTLTFKILELALILPWKHQPIKYTY